jgi:AraC-like DNA-binding protein
MIKENIYQSVEVTYKKVDHCPIDHQQFTFFQMVYVISGTGELSINGNLQSYQSGKLLLLTPNDHHNFEIHTTSEFLLIRFTSAYVKEYSWKSIDHIECLLYYSTHLSGCILHSESDQMHVKAIVSSLLYEINNDDVYNKDLIIHFINALIVITARNISKIRPASLKVNTDKRVLEIINHIQNNIYHPQDLKISFIAETYGFSKTYLGSYFKNQCGESLQHYISNYKLRLIEHRLSFSDMRINEIVEEFGFADESHLNKFFKRHKGVSMSAFRNLKITV